MIEPRFLGDLPAFSRMAGGADRSELSGVNILVAVRTCSEGDAGKLHHRFRTDRISHGDRPMALLTKRRQVFACERKLRP